MSKVLIISPDEPLRDSLHSAVTSVVGVCTVMVDQPAEAIPLIRAGSIQSVLLDLRCADQQPQLRALLTDLDSPGGRVCLKVIGIADLGYPQMIWTLLARVLTGCVMTPVQPEALMRYLTAHDDDEGRGDRAAEERTLGANGLAFTTRTAAMFPFLSQLERVAVRDVTLLFTGETGTGKSYLAQLVHELSERRSGPFFATACGALPPDLIETELFGHVRGAFTSAVRSSEGRFEAARGGTLLLDEIDVLGPKEQSRLLHVIETGKYEPVGSTDTKIADVRLIVASNVDLKGLAERHQFRADLYYRLNVLEFHLMPLRQRPHDIIPLATRFIDETCERHGIPITHMHPDFLTLLKQYHWPGNIRELLNQMRRAVLLSKDGILTADSLSLDLRPESDSSDGNGHAREPVQPTGWNLNRRLAHSEREFLVETLRAHNNNRAATARALGISRTALYKKMHRLGVVDAGDGADAISAVRGAPNWDKVAIRGAS